MQISGLSASNTFSATDVLAIEINVNGVEKTYKLTGATLAAALASIGSYLKTTDVVNNLTSTDPTKVLAAPQGKALKDLIEQSTAIPFVEGSSSQTSVSLTTGPFRIGFLFGIYRSGVDTSANGYAILFNYSNDTLVIAAKTGLSELSNVTYSNGSLTLVSSTGYKTYAFIKLG